MSNAENYQRITDTIISLVEKGGLLPWQKPWKASDVARSMATGKNYKGINNWILTATADAYGWSPWFGTYKQIAALGGQVRKGEKSSLAILWKPMERIVDGNTEKFMLLRTFSVFSASQADGLPEKYYAKPTEADIDITEAHEEADKVFAAYIETQGIPVAFGGSNACYSPVKDSIKLPLAASFDSPDHYFATAFHEAAHSTGAQSRLARPGVTDFDSFGSHQYSREELVAEFTSALVLGTLGLDKPNVIENQAAYLASWKSRLVEDPQALVWAAGRAEKAADLIFGVVAETATEVAS